MNFHVFLYFNIQTKKLLFLTFQLKRTLQFNIFVKLNHQVLTNKGISIKILDEKMFSYSFIFFFLSLIFTQIKP